MQKLKYASHKCSGDKSILGAFITNFRATSLNPERMFRQRTLNSDKKISQNFPTKLVLNLLRRQAEVHSELLLCLLKNVVYHRKVITIVEYSIIIS